MKYMRIYILIIAYLINYNIAPFISFIFHVLSAYKHIEEPDFEMLIQNRSNARITENRSYT